MRLHVASRNAGKIEEMHRLLDAHVAGVEIVGLDDVAPYDEPVEDGATFADNALLKARAGYAATGLPSIADDSGLCVDALNGMPGVLSARWSGPPKSDARNNELLLAQLADVPDERRGARFRCVVAYVDGPGDDDVLLVEGVMPGRVIRETRGSGGFGYDVVFVPAAAEPHTSAELASAAKDAISHRGRALREIAPQVARRLAGGGR
ncbi:MAG: RdgB/HAM1 family non-canonical purine NTP pyrophosphatase [Nocardioides sp.]|uniref:RdgB/HAM1 family non-canonical purine NTP pyrophosphatase n=1 Tax=Nocardioides sp. TaxID=35761 RepID=UPI0039E41289